MLKRILQHRKLLPKKVFAQINISSCRFQLFSLANSLFQLFFTLFLEESLHLIVGQLLSVVPIRIIFLLTSLWIAGSFVRQISKFLDSDLRHPAFQFLYSSELFFAICTEQLDSSYYYYYFCFPSYWHHGHFLEGPMRPWIIENCNYHVLSRSLKFPQFAGRMKYAFHHCSIWCGKWAAGASIQSRLTWKFVFSTADWLVNYLSEWLDWFRLIMRQVCKQNYKAQLLYAQRILNRCVMCFSTESSATLHPGCIIKRQVLAPSRRSDMINQFTTKREDEEPIIEYLAFQELSKIDEGLTVSLIGSLIDFSEMLEWIETFELYVIFIQVIFLLRR